MADILDLYSESYDAARPVVCFDERPVQLIGETRTPVPAEPQMAARINYDYEYTRYGTCIIFVRHS